MAIAAKCPCGDAVCNNWHVSPHANVLGVSFTRAEAEAVATLLNGAVLIAITDIHIVDMLVGAIESNGMTRSWCAGIYWGDGPSDNPPLGDTPWYTRTAVIGASDFKIGVFEIMDESKSPHGDNLKRHVLTKDDLVRGFSVMAEIAPRHFGDWLNENPDEITYDVWLQCAVLKEIVYG